MMKFQFIILYYCTIIFFATHVSVFLLLLLIIIYDGVDMYDETITMDWYIDDDDDYV